LNVGFTAAGLAMLGVPLDAFPPEFANGAGGAFAAAMGDVGDSAPEKWIASLRGTATHAILSLYTPTDDLRRDNTDVIQELLSKAGVSLLEHRDHDDLPGSFVHFGYRDGISQPVIKDAPVLRSLTASPDPQTELTPLPPGTFILGLAGTFPVPAPADVTTNGSYSAFRIIKQDVAAFYEFIDREAAAAKLDPALLHAKVCGRWSNGSALELYPDAMPETPDLTNDFAYAADDLGARCPIGSHARRSMPRDTFDGFSHRILRRAFPYGPDLPHGQPDDGVERGLIGHFICGDIGQQFAFITQMWVNGTTFGNLIGGEPLVGSMAGDNQSYFFVKLEGKKRIKIPNVVRFAHTVGAANLFLPSITGLGVLAG